MVSARTPGRQPSAYSPPEPCLDLTLISSAISLPFHSQRHHRISAICKDYSVWHALLKLSAFITKLSYFCEKYTNFARKGFAEVVQVSVSNQSILYLIPIGSKSVR